MPFFQGLELAVCLWQQSSQEIDFTFAGASFVVQTFAIIR